MKFKTLALAILLPLLLNACATNRGIVNLNVPKPIQAKYNGETIFIKSVVDKRVFEEKPSSPDVPSLGFGGSQQASAELKKRAIARKRNGFGKAMGDILLKDGETVESVIKDSLSRSFTELGYKVISEKSQITKNTIVVDASIDKFWSWMNMGFWTLKLTSEIDVKITLEKHHETKKVYVTHEGRFITASGRNWLKVMNKNLDKFNDETKKVMTAK